MNLHLTGHVIQRMAERGIDRRQIEEALDDLLSEWDTPQGAVQYLGRTADGRQLTVWIVAPGLSATRPIVKSAAWR